MDLAIFNRNTHCEIDFALLSEIRFAKYTSLRSVRYTE